MVSAFTSSTPCLIPATNHSDLVGHQPPVWAGTYEINRSEEPAIWHTHNYHQLEYAFEGTAEVETATARYLLPPQQAIWIPAGVEHSSTVRGVRGVSVFFDPATGMPAGDRVRILPAASVVREMIRYALRWPISRTTSDHVADAFFEALGHLVAEWLDAESPLHLPTSRDPLVAAAIAYLNDHLRDVTLSDVCDAVGTSERTLRRSFLADVGMSWRQYVHESRILRSMALLAEDQQNVLAAAVRVGFNSPSAFTRAFTTYAGETPSSYRMRVRSAGVATPRGGAQIPGEYATILGMSHLLPGPSPIAV